MPTYEYVCSKCDQHLEVYQSFSEEPLRRHAGCGGKLSKVLGSVGIVLKGSGFYKTDNRSSSKRSGSKESNGKGESSEKSTDTTTDTKSSSADSSGSGSGDKKSGSDSGSGSSSEKKPAAKSA